MDEGPGGSTADGAPLDRPPSALASSLPTALPTALPRSLPTALPRSLPTALPTALPATAGPLRFEILGRCSTSKARVATMTLPHHTVDTPVFMPVGTQGTMKGLTSDQLHALGCQIILGNTYHLGNRPVRERHRPRRAAQGSAC